MSSTSGAVRGARPSAPRPPWALKTGWQLLRETVTSWSNDYAPSMGAALSYYTLFSIAPLLLIVISIAGMVFGREAAQGEIVAQLQGLMGEDGAHAVQGLLESASKPEASVLASLASFALLLFGAGFVVKWLFILAAIAALLFLISLFMGGWRGRTTY